MTGLDPATLRRMVDLNAVYRMYDHDGRLLYVGRTGDPGTRFSSHTDKRWFLLVADIKLEWFPTKAAAALAEDRAIQNERPRINIAGSKRRPQRPAAGPMVTPLRPTLGDLLLVTPLDAELTEKVRELTQSTGEGRVSLPQAVRLGILGCTISDARKLANRDKSFPAPTGVRGANYLYAIHDLKAYEVERQSRIPAPPVLASVRASKPDPAPRGAMKLSAIADLIPGVTIAGLRKYSTRYADFPQPVGHEAPANLYDPEQVVEWVQARQQKHQDRMEGRRVS